MESLGSANDYLFRKVMENPNLCIKLLNRILPELDIERIEYLETQKSIAVSGESKSIQLDVYVRDDKQTVYNIEIQTSNTGELPKRSRYYQALLDLHQLEAGQNYRELNQSIVIFICLFDPFKMGLHSYTFRNLCLEEPALALEDGTTKIFLNATSELDDVSPELRSVLDYLVGRETNDPYVTELMDAVSYAKMNNEWRHEYMLSWIRNQDIELRGKEKGLQEGKLTEKDNTIQRMLSHGFSHEQICIACDITEEELLTFLSNESKDL